MKKVFKETAVILGIAYGIGILWFLLEMVFYGESQASLVDSVVAVVLALMISDRI